MHARICLLILNCVARIN